MTQKIKAARAAVAAVEAERDEVMGSDREPGVKALMLRCLTETETARRRELSRLLHG